MSKKSNKISFIVASIIAVIVLLATYFVLAPTMVVANESSTTYAQVQETTSNEATVKVYESEPVGSSVLETDPVDAEQALGVAELVEVTEPPQDAAAETFVDETGTQYTKVISSTSSDGVTINVYESESVELEDGGLGSAELIEIG